MLICSLNYIPLDQKLKPKFQISLEPALRQSSKSPAGFNYAALRDFWLASGRSLASLLLVMAAPSRARSLSAPASLKTPQADVLRLTREDHASEIAEDYLEAIADLSATAGAARVTALARQFGVSHVTVTRTVSRLHRAGYVTTQPYRAISLTEKGRTVAEKSKKRHLIVVQFLRSLGLPEFVVQRDAEGMEHHVSPETLAAMEKHTAK